MKTFSDENLLLWEAYPSGGRYGFSQNAHIAFHCLSDATIRPRYFVHDGDNADAERAVREATPDTLLALLNRATPLP
jgi:hypothetical protein